MSTVHIQNSSGRLWALAVGALAVAGAVGAWWVTRPAGPGTAPLVTAGAGALSRPAAAQDSPIALVPGQDSPDMAAIVARQADAAEVVKKQPLLRPVNGPITSRPDYISEMEWGVVQGMSQQAADPAREVTRMVNYLRFMKQLEVWRTRDGGTDPAQREALALSLLEELPVRLKNGEMPSNELRPLQLELLKEAYRDPGVRQQRAALELKRLHAAEPAPEPVTVTVTPLAGVRTSPVEVAAPQGGQAP